MYNVDLQRISDILESMKSSKVANYVIAGLDSYLVGGEGHGNVRLFENSRDHQDSITPHSHRFDFVCLVLEGEVYNELWTLSNHVKGDYFQLSELSYKGDIGQHSRSIREEGFYYRDTFKYVKGQVYSMRADQIHSIRFSKDAKVLFFEGPNISDKSVILEPIVNGEVIPTYQVKPYMFKRGE